MNKPRITPVANNIEKQEAYRTQMQRYKTAIKYGFFLEAIMIDYAMIEDRMRSLLFHVAFLYDRKAKKAWKKTRPYFTKFVQEYKTDVENTFIGISNISGKIKIIRSMLCWVSETSGGYQDDKILVVLKYKCEELDIGGILDTLNEIEDWCKYRNEIVHALLNKNTSSVYSELEELAEKGMEYARFIDSQVRILKKDNYIRKQLGLPIEK